MALQNGTSDLSSNLPLTSFVAGFLHEWYLHLSSKNDLTMPCVQLSLHHEQYGVLDSLVLAAVTNMPPNI